MTVSIDYAWAQLLHERRTAAEHPDPLVRERAGEAVAKWQATIAGMRDGTIKVGSRTPTKAPAWVTLEVVTGGFATGGYSAGGPLRDHERALVQRLGVRANRFALNIHYLESPETSELLASGRYQIDVPEEGALLVAAWLRERGELDRANELVAAIAPWFGELRFYPAPAGQPYEMRDTVRCQDVGVTLDGLAKERRQRRFETMRQALLVWTPLRDRAIGLFLETIAGEYPRMAGEQVTGGSLATKFPAGWQPRVAQLVTDRARAGKPASARARETSDLIARLARCANDPGSLTQPEYLALRRTIARHIAAHGTPGTPEAAARRAAEARAVTAPLHADLRRVVVERLSREPRTGGLDLDRAAAPVTLDEAARFPVPAGSGVPAYLADKLARSWDAPLEALMERRVIPSSEVLARVLPQVTAQVRAQTIDDAAVRRLYAAMYTAFRRRRGLLLVAYQHQVRFHELPWVAALEAARRVDAAAAAGARDTVARASSAAIQAFPYTIVPNKLVTELYALGAAAELKLSLVEELAADIFMGSFTEKFVAAAQVAARLLANTLYERYYGIDFAEIARLPLPANKTSPELATLCEQRAAAVGSGAGHGVARNGKIIEQSQILTTHNLAVLFDALALPASLAPSLRRLAESCFRWIVRQLRIPARSGHETLIRLKNTAYAWRQMVFYLSFVEDVPDFLRWARGQLTHTGDAFQQRVEPAIRGLELAAGGVPSSAAAFSAGGGRVFTGWATERHWLSPQS